MTSSFRRFGLMAALFASAPAVARADGLSGSPASMVHQHAIAVQERYSFLRTALDVTRLATQGQLVAVAPSSDLVMAGVSFPYARPEVRDFVARFARDYRDSTGVPVTITSLTRPEALQPRNAHKLSVHPAGMAVDFRVPQTPAERAFLERALLRMEKAGMLDVTREKTPAHYHVAVFAAPMLTYLAQRNVSDPILPRRPDAQAVSATAPPQRSLALVPRRIMTDSVDESRLPLFLLAMTALLGMALALLHAPRPVRAPH